MFDLSKSIVQRVYPSFLNNTSKKLFVKRDDLIDPLVSGNKWRKLKLNVECVREQKLSGIVTFGGAYSNHLLATASACAKSGLRSVGVVRGHELEARSNSLLEKCHALGMELCFVSREEYALRNEKSFIESFHMRFPNMHIVPEGGANYYGIIGCQSILLECGTVYDRVFVAQGTSTTSCGVASILSEKTVLQVIPVIKGYDSVKEMRMLYSMSGFDKEWTEEIMSNVRVMSDFHFGGYGRYTPELLDFMEQFYQETNIPLDPVYTGKAMFALMDYCRNNPQEEEHLLFIHTGGIEGGRNIAEKYQKKFC
ncbi:MAG: hypothetical protein RIT43_449 [Bacteroidota bacterium]